MKRIYILLLLGFVISGCGGKMPDNTPTPIPPTPTPTPIPPTPTPFREGDIITVTSTKDSGLGTLRQALLDAQNGDTITFDPAVFPAGAPVTISVTSGLPAIG